MSDEEKKDRNNHTVDDLSEAEEGENAGGRQRQLLLILQSLVKASRKNRGVITEKQLEKALEGLSLTEEQMQLVRDYLQKNGVGIDDPLDEEIRMTDEDKNYLEEYKKQVEQIPQPDEGVKDAIKIRAMAGEKEAQNELAEFMLPVVVDIARLYAGQGVYMEDLIGAGNEALVCGTKLLAPLEGPQEVEAALAERIMNAMEDLIAANLDAFSVDQSAADQANKVLDKAEELAEMLGRKVTVDELAAEGDLTREEIMNAISNTANKIEPIDYKPAQ